MSRKVQTWEFKRALSYNDRSPVGLKNGVLLYTEKIILFLTYQIASQFCKWIYERSYIWTTDEDMKTWLIIAVMHTTQAVVKFKSEKIQAWTGFCFVIREQYQPFRKKIKYEWIISTNLHSGVIFFWWTGKGNKGGLPRCKKLWNVSLFCSY